jgi:hypothetical protein
MKRFIKYFLCLFIFYFIFGFKDVFAVTSSNLSSVFSCPTGYQLGTANTDDSFSSIECYNTYDDAKNAMNNLTISNKDDAIILEKNGTTVKVIDAYYALVYLNIGDDLTYHYLSATTNTSYTYMNHYTAYGASDAAFIEFSPSTRRVKLRISGLTSWVKDGYYKIIPLNWVKKASYYQITESHLTHYYGKNIETTYTADGRNLGPKPENINTGTYYSYDGIYFYSNYKTMLQDYRNGNFNNAVNKNNPYYNYYMYLPHRTKTTYSSININEYFREIRSPKIIGYSYGRHSPTGYSALYGQGGYFTYAQNTYGSNAISMLGLSMNESANGTSTIAMDKNNIFGHNAVDSSAYSSATGYLDVKSSILGHANTWISRGYSNISDSRYFGGHFGNKLSGMNVMYASDPYWGEKAANYYYSFDLANGLEDYNYYQLGLINYNGGVNARTEPRTNANIPFMFNKGNIPVVILEEVTGDVFEGSNVWYKIVSDANLNSNRTSINSTSWAPYNWDSYVYVHSSLVTKINTGKNKVNNKYNSPKTIYEHKDTYYQYVSYASGATYTPVVGKIKANTNAYYESTLDKVVSDNNQKTILKDKFVTIFEKALDKDGNVVSYLVNTLYSINQKHWVRAEDIEIIPKDIAKVIVNARQDYINVKSSPTGSNIGTIYTDTYPVVLDYKIIDGSTWLEIQYNLTGTSNSTGWINTTTDKGTITYTLNNTDQDPVINVSNKSILIGTTFNPLEGITATDKEDGNLTSSITCDASSYKDEIGTYTISCQVTDSKGHITRATYQLTVYDYTTKQPLYLFNSLNYIDNNTFEFSGFLGIKGMDNTKDDNIKQRLIFVNQLDGSETSFNLDRWLTDYPYEVSSLDDTKKYNYNGGWFKSNIDLSKGKISAGDYTIYVEVVNGEYKTRTLFNNVGFVDMTRRKNTTDRGFYIESDYSTIGSPILLSIRDNFLITDIVPPTIDPMYNFFNSMSLTNNNLYIKGTSHNYGIDYSAQKLVNREIIFENVSTFARYTYNLGSITTGDYVIELRVSDGKDKTRAWYESNIDLSTLPQGKYAIYIKTTVGDFSSYGELIDVAYTDFSKISTSKYEFSRNENKRLRVELNIN